MNTRGRTKNNKKHLKHKINHKTSNFNKRVQDTENPTNKHYTCNIKANAFKFSVPIKNFDCESDDTSFFNTSQESSDSSKNKKDCKKEIDKKQFKTSLIKNFQEKDINSSFGSEIDVEEDKNSSTFFSPEKNDNYDKTAESEVLLNKLKQVDKLIYKPGKSHHNDKLNKHINNKHKQNTSNNKNNKVSNKNRHLNKSNTKTKIDLVKVQDLIYEYCNNNDRISKSFHIKHLKGNYNEIIRTKENCQLLQKLLSLTKKSLINEIFLELQMYISDLMVDLYSNYFCQILYNNLLLKNSLLENFKSKLSEYDSNNLPCRETFLEAVFSDFDYIACNKVGTFPLQKIIDEMQTSDEIDILLNFIDRELKEKRLEEICRVSLF
jgi:hypothetical protein